MNDEIQRLHTHDEFKEAEVRARIDELETQSEVWSYAPEDAGGKLNLQSRISNLEAQLKEKV